MQKKELYEKLNNGMLCDRYSSFKRNLKKNKRLIDRYGGLLKVIPSFENKHIIVVGAGPSLVNNIDQLKKIQYRESVEIICADMALGPLIKRGIFPGYVISCEITPRAFFSGIDTRKMHLLAFSCVANTNLSKWQGDISFYNWMLKEKLYSDLWEEAGEELGFVATGSIVTTQAVSIVLGCNIKSLLLVGNDLACTQQYYVKGNILEKSRLALNSRINPLDNIEFVSVWKNHHYYFERDKTKYFVNHQFLAAKYWFEDLFKQVNFPVYDAGLPGCFGENIIKISMKEYLNLHKINRKRRR